MPTKVWQLQDAKNRFSEVVNRALAEGPQIVTRRGEEVAVVLSTDEYNRLKKSKSSLREFFRESPLVGVDLEVERDQSYPRDTHL
ncbi:MAG TPA: type II toxin-antitoxin system Phd/YefM family antitoxin [Anaerolineales bacterium]|jgi:prevent-host-death family protein|nr:type II toxin-antitoxin system Phd/YefM family antitoxin [Anaerolineales bacterium]